MITLTKSLIKMFKRCRGKKEVCRLLDISPRTLANWMNVRYYQELRELGYTPNQKLLTPAQLNYLADKIGLDREEEPHLII
jgi:Asp-tRNA(Asn)/Glu-tRNA(Gln) amidotransferase B subunit